MLNAGPKRDCEIETPISRPPPTPPLSMCNLLRSRYCVLFAPNKRAQQLDPHTHVRYIKFPVGGVWRTRSADPKGETGPNTTSEQGPIKTNRTLHVTHEVPSLSKPTQENECSSEDGRPTKPGGRWDPTGSTSKHSPVTMFRKYDGCSWCLCIQPPDPVRQTQEFQGMLTEIEPLATPMPPSHNFASNCGQRFVGHIVARDAKK